MRTHLDQSHVSLLLGFEFEYVHLSLARQFYFQRHLIPLTDVQIIAQQSAPVKLNAQGEGEVSLPIPEFNGEVRLMAQAWTADKFGSQEGKVVIAAPLVTQLSLPRFMAGGDSAPGNG